MGLRNPKLRSVGSPPQPHYPGHAEDFLDTLNSLPIRLTDPPSYDAVFALAARYALTVYDAAYLELAIREGLPVATLDNALTRAAEQSGVAVFKP